MSKQSFLSLFDSLDRQPSRCLILQTNGELSLLDLDEGRERELTDSVELFWVTCGKSKEKANLIEEVSWLDYDHRGMQLDAELEFDREVYPLGLLQNARIVVGITKECHFSGHRVSLFGAYSPGSNHIALSTALPSADKVQAKIRQSPKGLPLSLFWRRHVI